jgi:ATP-dependent helicase Lhr and Lhr-like helicase
MHKLFTPLRASTLKRLKPHTHREPGSRVFAWFRGRYGAPTLPQEQSWPLIAAGKNLLLASPTGTGKTFAAFLGVLDALVQQHDRGELSETIHCVYISPLRALSYDLEKNLADPLRELFGEKSPIRVELRTGDTTASQRQRQYTRPPHILLTTPESLCVLLSQEKWLRLLASTRWIIIDEIHALAENKRGAHLAISIERLVALASQTPQRIGLSATIAPLNEVARYLTGTHGACEIVDATSDKRVELSVYTPLRKDPYPGSGYTGERLVRELGHLIHKYRTTLVFCNTRSGAEGTTYWLRLHFPELAPVIECHHASLEREVRREVEDRLKRGELRAVVCSTSLEMGIDIGSVDLVVMMSTPKGVSKALQRAGRAGHNIRSVSRGVLMATNVSDLVESCATVLLARRRHLDEVRLPRAPLDVLAQQLVSMGCTARWTRQDALELIRRAYPYAELSASELDDVLDYLAGGGASLRAQYTETFGKIVLDDEGFETREGRVRREFLQNIGVIPNVGQVRIRLHARVLGSVEESFIRGMRVGDIFALAGRSLRLEKISQMDAWVSRADGETPTVPRWNANKMPLSNRVCEEIMQFRGELQARLPDNGERMIPWIAERLDCGVRNAEMIWRMHAAQSEISEIPTADFLLVEELFAVPEREDAGRETRRKKRAPRTAPNARHYFFHTLIGRAANDALARVIAYRLSQLRGGNAVATPHDYGFILTVTPAQHFTAEELPGLLHPDGFELAVHEALRQSDMLQYHFRNAAQTGLMVYRNYFGEQKSVRKLTWSAEVIFNVLQRHEPDHVLLREARRDTLATFLDVDTALAFLCAQQQKPIRLRHVDKVPPLAFAMYMTKIKEALLIEDPFELQERLFHQWWKELEAK